MSRTNLTGLGDGSEFDKIRAIWRTLGDRAVGGGDDCAFLEIGGLLLAVSTDMAVEGTHFRTDWLSPREIGWRAGAAALSDLAAVAAEPVGLMVSLGLPADWSNESAASLMDGIGAVAESVGATVRGGDLVRSGAIVVDVVVFGLVTKPMLRSGAGAGDTLWVTGSLGGPVTAIGAWENGAVPDKAARERFVGPVPRFAEARWLRDHGATALIDLSDGLVVDAGQLGAASGVACVIEAARVPVSAGADKQAALLGGEEYELLVAMPESSEAELGSLFVENFSVSLTGIGHVEDGSGVRVMNAGVPMDLSGGFRHFES